VGKTIQLFGIALVLLLGGLAGLRSVTTASDAYYDAAHDYANTGSLVYLHDVPKSLEDQVLTELVTKVAHNNGFVIRGDALFDQISGAVSGIRFGVAGDAKNNAEEAAFSYLGTDIFTAENLSTLLAAKTGKTLGLDQVRADQLMPLPSAKGGTKIVAVKLDDLVQKSHTVNGTYRVMGLSDAQFQSMLTDLAKTLSTNTDALTTPMSGSVEFDSFMKTLLLRLGAATWIALVFILILAAYQSMSRLGIHVLLGWSRVRYSIKVFFPLLLTALIAPFISLGLQSYTLEGFRLSGSAIQSGLLAGTPVIFLTAVAAVIASSVILSVKPVNAVRNRISTKILTASLLVFYIASSAGLVGSMYLVDGPTKEISKLQRVQTNWKKYANLQMLYDARPGNDNLSDPQGKYIVDFYRWYQSIENKPGVYLANTQHFSSKLLREYRNNGVYDHVPLPRFGSSLRHQITFRNMASPRTLGGCARLNRERGFFLFRIPSIKKTPTNCERISKRTASQTTPARFTPNLVKQNA
jgi:hypothetical protein